jgi:hypothetical protein
MMLRESEGGISIVRERERERERERKEECVCVCVCFVSDSMMCSSSSFTAELTEDHKRWQRF